MQLYKLRDIQHQNFSIEEPLRSELFSSDQMEQYAKQLATGHKLLDKPKADHLLSRLADNESTLVEVRNLLTEALKDNKQISPSGEWLLDNFYLIEEQIRLAKKHLPKGYSEGLPQLAGKKSLGVPRVYDIALQIISHSDGRFDMQSVNSFLASYHTVTALKLGELWAIPIMLRLALIENLRRVSAHIAIDRENRNLADYWAQLMIKAAESDPKSLILVIADMARSNPPLERAFVAELTRQLRGRGPGLAQALNCLEERLSESGLTSTELVQEENQKQAADQLSVSNSINSLRLLGSMDWRSFVESISVVEKIMRRDDIYQRLDFATRDQYRHVVEWIAKKAKSSEPAVAETALQLAEAQSAKTPGTPEAHIGYYLIGEGREQVEKISNVQLPLVDKVKRTFSKIPFATYLFFILVLTGLTSLAIFYRVLYLNNPWLIAFFVTVGAVSASQLAVSLVNFFCTLFVGPVLLPKLDYSKGIPAESSTLVAIPSMLINEEEVEDLIESLEIRFLANKDRHLYFGLITDFTDALDEHLPGDEGLLNFAVEKIEQLNQKYAADGAMFFLFHRPRRWNAAEKKWMGYERKRGKLTDLNGLLRGNAKDAFAKIVGDVSVLQTAKYVITLDSDTQLPRDAAAKMVATMAHPLNEAVYDEKKQRVIRGYGILQPRVMISLPRQDSSLYAKINGNEPGIDPYTRATSDVYQDLFKEGSFIGKGIYNVDIFEKVLKGKFPENRILSHDLLEGCYTRSGLLSDVQLFEKYPAKYSTDMKRRHRWIRGDWQIAAWFTPFVPDVNNRWHKNPLSALSRWKIFDNIRRSLFPIAITLLIISGWLLLPKAGWWTLMVSLIIVLPAVAVSVWDVIRKPRDVIFRHHLILASRNAGNTAISTMFTLVCLPYEAFVNLDAMLRTAWRMWISHRHLLEWSPAQVTAARDSNSFWASYRNMAIEPLIAVGVAVYLYLRLPVVYPVAGPILLLWLCAPLITWLVSRPLPKIVAELSPQQKIYLQKLSRKTWAFFDVLVNETENWLPPDNLQEVPVPVIAHRTSPTNIGLALLSNLSACDFGFITTGQFIDRTQKTFATLGRMERYHGHFYNWYDTQTIGPLLPHYVSTVDSGNLAGHLLTLRQGIIALRGERVVTENIFEGISSTLRVLADNVGKDEFLLLHDFKIELEKAQNAQPANFRDLLKWVENLSRSYDDLGVKLNPPEDSAAGYWKGALAKQISAIIYELQQLIPWLFVAHGDSTIENLIKSAGIPTHEELSELNQMLLSQLADGDFRNGVLNSETKLQQRFTQITQLENQSADFANLEWDFLYDKGKSLLSIGYNVDEHRVDASYYDLLASEARLAIFFAIAQGKIPQESWFALGRHLLNIDGDAVLLSWSGSMFEYLMPMLVMPGFTNTLLSQTDDTSVQRQIDYGKQMGVPWGISECCYNTIDAMRNYQYRAFGVPGLGLKRGLGEDLVIAPYASVLALMVEPEKSCQNLEKITALGFEGKYGLYEAIDYTATRLQRGQTYALIQSFMAHHQGMSLLSLASVLLGQPMQKRFEADPSFNATLLLLEERIPKMTSFYIHTTDIADTHAEPTESEVRVIRSLQTPVPEVQLLSNGNYHLMLTAAGGGYSKWRDYAITRWREDATCDNWGTFCYIRDVDQNTFWSTSHQPTHKKGSNYEVAFSQGRADFRDMHNGIETHTEIVVSPEDDIEMRRVHITNRTGRRKVIEFTTYAEVAIAHPGADAAHPAFSKLFVQTEILEQHNAIICSRRPQSANEKVPWMFHLVKVHTKNPVSISYETDRAKFIGRTHTLTSPAAMMKNGTLSGSQGAVIDPCVAIRYRLEIEDDETVIVDILIGATETRDACQLLIDKYQDKHHKDRVFELAWTHNQVVLRQINASEAEAQLYTRLAGSIIFMNPLLRAEAGVLLSNQRGQSGLWPYSVSGDLPIVFIRVEEQTKIDLIKQLIQAHTYWRLKGLAVDLVIWNENYGGYRQVIQNEIMGLVSTLPTEKSGGIYVRASDQISVEDRILFQTVARINISGAEGSLADFVNKKGTIKPGMPFMTQIPVAPSNEIPSEQLPALLFKNGTGGFTPDGKEYVITVTDKKPTPAPWVNILTNPSFGTIVSESGHCYTWAENAHEFRLTPWSNDPVSDTGGEAFYLRDEETGHYWSVSSLPRATRTGYTIRHGFGYSVFEHTEAGIKSEMTVYVDLEAAIKFTVIKLENISGLPRKISVTGYTEWVLGEQKAKSAMFVTTEWDTETGTLFARNTYNKEFEGRAAFFDTDEINKTFTGDRTEFIGRNNTLRNPDAMLRTRLSGKRGVGVDPCAAIQVYIDLPDETAREVTFKLGAGKSYNEAKNIVKQFTGADKAQAALQKVKAYWSDTLGKIKVETPDAGLNVLANGWLPYQVLACRIWGRAGFYQSSGAFGYRDQLQDSLALLHAVPQVARKQIMLCATKQFKEGDAMHWWHPPVGRGVRTHCSDDFLWLPFATALYVLTTGDTAILQERAAYLEGRILGPDEESNYDLPTQSSEVGTLYEHCVKAIRHGLRYGDRGLPLMGTGDWNDGMNEVGRHGKGESVWLAFFLYDILKQFGKLAGMQGDVAFSEECENEALKLQQNIEKSAWDGNWYIRAFFDNGMALGSAANDECKIDCIAQSWAVISGAGDVERQKTAMQSAYTHLVDQKLELIKLLAPPFDKSNLEPGYIKGYVPGVRENGGQYTHAAVWLVMAFAKLGDNSKVWELFNLINPINHTKTPQSIAVYRDEPYVMAGDVYAQSHPAQGGWSWYTGSAGWMYRLITESMLGMKMEEGKLHFEPCVPADWKSFKITYRYKTAVYNIAFTQSNNGKRAIVLDGEPLPDHLIILQDDGAEHHIEVEWTVVEMTTV